MIFIITISPHLHICGIEKYKDIREIKEKFNIRPFIFRDLPKLISSLWAFI